MTNPTHQSPVIRLLSTGGPTALIEVGGLRLLTDPTFDEPGDYVSRSGASLTKTEPAVLGPEALGRIDAVLLSHDEHPDNLDRSGRALLAEVPLVLTTTSGAGRLSAAAVPAVGLAPWEPYELARPDGGTLRVTALPAQHGPAGCEPVTGQVLGFLLHAPDLPSVYVSGDNASLALVEQVAERFGPVDTAVIFAGAARVPEVLGGAALTLDSAEAAEAARILGSRRAVVLHCDSWAHFSDDYAAVEAAFDKAGRRALLPEVRHGQEYVL
ncbi:MBL fold metallo-hydrolase [Actinospica durhamensis]|uniref:MBL fold metallo-hydrolase n=1 Tax=Actinospica durhamensis TaxID=1508375 RepID=A0A941IN72_9ACTN|nr:MBL fold metallo-hydrolase [Actinospica durhamensis]MBR7833654.1 MBL fold metallo-hydrolase [Actinospica durhamensis]